MKKKSLFAFVAFVQISTLILTPLHGASALFASNVGGKVKGGIDSYVTEDLGVDSNDLRLGVGNRKAFAPQVTVITSEEGDYMTARAVVQGISNTEDAYYTWYLRNDNEEDADGNFQVGARTNQQKPATLGAGENIYPRADYITQEDVNEYEIDDVDRWFIAATRERIKKSFDFNRYDDPFNGGNNDSVVTDADAKIGGGASGDDNTYFLDPSIIDNDGDKDGHKAFLGGDNATDDEVTKYCVLYDGSSGFSHELWELDGYDLQEIRDNADSDVFSLSSEPLCSSIDATTGEAINLDLIPVCLEEEEVLLCPVSVPQVTSTVTPTVSTDLGVDTTTNTTTATTELTTTAESSGAGGVRDLPLYECAIGSEVVCESFDYSFSRLADGSIQFGPNTDVEGTNTIETASNGNFTPLEVGDDGDEGSVTGDTEDLPDDLDIERGRPVCRDSNGSARPVCIKDSALLLLSEQVTIDGIEDGFNKNLCTDPNINGRTYKLDEDTNEYIQTASYDPSSTLCWTASEDPIEYQEPEPNPAPVTQIAELNLFDPTIQPQCPILPKKGALNNLCQTDLHLFPGNIGSNVSGLVSEETNCIADGDDVDNLSVNCNATGTDPEDGNEEGEEINETSKFTTREELFWGTDPEDPETVSGVPDEALIMGKGQDEFSWKFKEGDEIGVVVEGKGISATKHADGSFETVFAFMPGGCQPDPVFKYPDAVPGKKTIEIRAAVMSRDDIRECIRKNKKNFIAPGDSSEEKVLEVDVQGPIGTITNGLDYPISFKAYVNDLDTDVASPTEQLRAHYGWTIEYDTDPATEEFDASAPIISGTNVITDDYDAPVGEDATNDGAFMEHSSPAGTNVSEFSMLANFPDEVFPDGTGIARIRARVKVNAPQDADGSTRFGRDEFIITLRQGNTGDVIKAYTAKSFDENGQIRSFAKDGTIATDSWDLTCGEGGYLIGHEKNTLADQSLLCETIKHKILIFEIDFGLIKDANAEIALRSELVAWQVDGEDTFCDRRVFPACDNEEGRAFLVLPVLEDTGTHTITATITDPRDKSAASQTYSRSYTVVTPRVRILEGAPLTETSPGGRTFITGVTDSKTEPRSTGTYISTDPSNTSTNDTDFTEGYSYDASGDDVVSVDVVAIMDPAFIRVSNAAVGAGIVGGVQRDDNGNVTNSDSRDDAYTQALVEWSGPGVTENSYGPQTGIILNGATTVTAHAFIATPQDVRNALSKFWGVDQFESSPQIITTETSFMPDYTSTVETAGAGSIFATIASSTPAYFLFLIKIMLLGGLILYIASLALGSTRRSY